MQPEFAGAILRGCRDHGIHTAMETCGACTWEVLSPLADMCDLVLFDLKIMDDAMHRQWTGGSNRQILDNARRLAGKRVTIRLPLIPGITDTAENVAAISAFMQDAGLHDLALLPYNPAAEAKYEWVGRPYAIQGTGAGTREHARLIEVARGRGLRVALA